METAINRDPKHSIILFRHLLEVKKQHLIDSRALLERELSTLEAAETVMSKMSECIKAAVAILNGDGDLTKESAVSAVKKVVISSNLFDPRLPEMIRNFGNDPMGHSRKHKIHGQKTTMCITFMYAQKMQFVFSGMIPALLGK